MGHVRDRWKDPERRGRGKRWQVRYRVDGQQKDGGSYDTRAVAQRKLVELEAAVQRGQWIDPNDRTTVAEYLRAYAATRSHGERTRRRVDSLIRCHVEATQLGGRRLATVRPSEAQGWIADRAAVLAPSTSRQLVKFVRSAFAAAVLDRLVAESPFARITLPRVEREQFTPLTVTQVQALRDAMAPRYRAMVVVQAGLGLRLGELLALRTGDVDFLRRTVRIEWQIAQRTRERTAPKTPRARRTLPLPAHVGDALAEHLRAQPAGIDGLLFHTADGLPLWHEHYGTRVFRAAVAAAGLPAGTTSHDLRHHYATELLSAGLSVVEVAELLGHEDASQVVKVYGHAAEGFDVRARKALDAAWTAAASATGEAPAAQGRPE
jgi:integrase